MPPGPSTDRQERVQRPPASILTHDVVNYSSKWFGVPYDRRFLLSTACKDLNERDAAARVFIDHLGHVSATGVPTGSNCDEGADQGSAKNRIGVPGPRGAWLRTPILLMVAMLGLLVGASALRQPPRSDALRNAREHHCQIGHERASCSCLATA